MEGWGSLWSQYESNFGHHTAMMDHHHSTSSSASLESQFQNMRIGTPRNTTSSSSSSNTRILEDVSGRGSIVLMAKDRRGSQILITQLYGRTPQEITNILYEVISNDLHDLMMHHYGYRFLRALFQVISVGQMNIIIDLIIRSEHKFVQVCSNDNGSYAIQDLARYIFTAEKLVEFTMALKRNIVSLANNLNAGYVIKKCLTIFPNILCKEILNGVASPRNCILIATHKDGCCVIQNLLDHANHESSYLLVRQIIAYAPLLAPHPYGNYVLQFVIKKQDISFNALIVGRLEGKFVELSMNKFGSHVVENLLKNSTMGLIGLMIQEIINSPQFSNVLQCPFGNYVAQQALKFSVGSGVHNTLVNSIIFYEVYLQDHVYGKKVLASARRAQLKLQQLAT